SNAASPPRPRRATWPSSPHGGVGTLALRRYLGVAIDRSYDQPFQGHYWTLDGGRALHRWKSIAARWARSCGL
ncbi:MAG: hypothetical protein U1E24_02050, partial [Phenylobacterium sp.]|nr:hypothetical protein [Phenylobacterium sp.]